MPATRDYNLSVDLSKLIGPRNTDRIKQVNIDTEGTLDGMSLYSPLPKFKMNELESIVSESQQSRRQKSVVSGIYTKEEALKKILEKSKSVV